MSKRAARSWHGRVNPLDSLQVWRSFADTVPDMLLLVGRDGTVQYINHPPPGVTREAVVGTSAFTYVPAEAEGELREAFLAILDGAVTRTRVQRAIHPDGTERWYQLHTGPVVADGEVVAVIIVARDVTDVHQAREALTESEARFRTLVEHAPEAIVVLDAEHGCFVDANQKACDLFGMTLAALKQHSPVTLSPSAQPDGAASSAAAHRQVEAALAGQSPMFEWVHRTRLGRDVRCEVRLVRLPSPRPLVRGSIIDITERRRLEEQLRESRKMDALGQLAAVIAHDFNNVLGAVSGSAEVILDTLEETHELHADAQAIVDAAQRGAALTSQLLVFARREVPETEHVDLNDVVRDIVGLAHRLIGHGIRIVQRLEPKTAPVHANRSQLEQVVMNLLLNARDALHGQPGTIAINTYTRLSASVLRIADTGCGMTEEVRGRIFEPFFTTKGRAGTGLGLATVYRIVTNVGGVIEVESAPGVGSAFEVRFPHTGHARERTPLSVDPGDAG